MNIQVLWEVPAKVMQFNSYMSSCHVLCQALSYAPGIQMVPIFKKFLQVQKQHEDTNRSKK